LFLKAFPKNTSHNPHTNEIINNLLYAIYDDKIDLDVLIPNNDAIYTHFKEKSLLSIGKPFQAKKDQVLFEKEIEEILGDRYKDGIRMMVKSK